MLSPWSVLLLPTVAGGALSPSPAGNIRKYVYQADECDQSRSEPLFGPTDRHRPQSYHYDGGDRHAGADAREMDMQKVRLPRRRQPVEDECRPEHHD